MKPLGYFINTPGDNTLFNDLETEYGSRFEKLTRRQKLYLIAAIATDLAHKVEGDEAPVSYAINCAVKVHGQMKRHDAEGFLDFLISQVRFGDYAQPSGDR